MASIVSWKQRMSALIYSSIICERRYYKSNKEIEQDQELQNFAKDVSTDGSGKVTWLEQ